jgi:hypothetical protein
VAGGRPPAAAPERVQEAKNAFWELWREEHCRQLAEETGDRLILALWQAYARERDELRPGVHTPACVSSDNGWLIRPESVEQKRPRNVFFWLSPFRRAVDDRERALREEGATPIEDRTEAERLAGERAQEIVDGHMRQGRYSATGWASLSTKRPMTPLTERGVEQSDVLRLKHVIRQALSTRKVASACCTRSSYRVLRLAGRLW